MSSQREGENERLIQSAEIYSNYTNDRDIRKNVKVPAIIDAGEPVNDQTMEFQFKQRMAIYVGLVMAIFLASLDSTIVSTALPTISSEFNALSDIPWVGTAYLLSSTASQPLYGKFSDIFGRKALFLCAIYVFLLGSLLCGAAQSMIMLVISRGIAGIGGGGIYSLVNVIIADIIPLRERGKYQGIIGATFSLSSVVGPLIGGALTDNLSWRWAFYINIPIGIAAIIVIVKLLNLPHVQGSLKAKLLRVDYFGTFIFVVAVVSILLTLNWGGNKYEWTSPVIILLLLAGAFSILMFIFYEVYVAPEPVITGRLFKIRNPLAVFACNFTTGITFLGLIFYLPVYYQAVKGDGAMEAGLRLAPLMLGIVITSAVSGFVTSWTGYYRGWTIVGYSLIAIGTGLLTTFTEKTDRIQEIIYILIIGGGFGASLQTSLIAAQTSVNYKDVAVVTSLTGFFRSIGGIVGVSISGSAFHYMLEKRLVEILPPNVSLENVMNSLSYVRTLPLDVQEPIIQSYMCALQYVFQVLTPPAVLSVFISLFIEHIPLRRTLGPRSNE
ncbi:hypothetical protein G9A89_001789 [Geosiphon pyriformis]|nr:hypothetical protein G9A89_001789 [Geosiphon pyriformis]